jgi:hypothetical protein
MLLRLETGVAVSIITPEISILPSYLNISLSDVRAALL